MIELKPTQDPKAYVVYMDSHELGEVSTEDWSLNFYDYVNYHYSPYATLEDLSDLVGQITKLKSELEGQG